MIATLTLVVATFVGAYTAKPIPHANLKAGDEVYLVWNWGRYADVRLCTVGRARWFGKDDVLELRWRDEYDGHLERVALDGGLVVYAFKRPANLHAARLLRAKAATYTGFAEELEREK